MSPALTTFLRVATNLWKAMGFALPGIPESARSALQTRIGDGDARWTLALLLAAWSLSQKEEPGAEEIQTVIRQAEAGDVIPQIELIKSMPGFMMFMNSARQAQEDKDLVSPAAYFAGAVTELDFVRSHALQVWLRSKRFLEIGRALVDRFPVPGSANPPVWQSPPDAPNGPAGRGQRFDRADFGPRRGGRTARASAPEESESAPLSPSATTPLVDEEDITRAHLSQLGWSAQQAAAILQGPKKA